MNTDDIADYRRMVSRLESDLQQQVERDADVKTGLQALWNEATDKKRTADEFAEWLDDYLTQVAVAWVLTGVFVRFLEDNDFVRNIRLAGEGKNRERADEARRLYFQENRAHADTDYMLRAFAQLAELPAGELFSEKRNPLWRVRISGDAGKSLLAFWRETDPDTGTLRRTFGSSDDRPDTRFLGDLYQDLSESARKKYALLQTPDFVEEYILDYTLEPAIKTFELEKVRFIDPTCGSGHFLLGGFHRIHEKLQNTKPGWSEAQRVRHALDATHGVDINPFAVAIARFRLLIAGLAALSPDRPVKLDEAPELPLHVAVGDSLIHGKRFPFLDSAGAQQELGKGFRLMDEERWSTEDADLIEEILGQQYHAVVGNPPYITPKDAAARDTYRHLYVSCHRQYALVCPFYERFFELAGAERENPDLFATDQWPHSQAGYVGLIVANSFMKREFGSKLIESVIPHTDLTHVIDTSGAYIPGHGTPTVILFGHNRAPNSDEVRAVLGIRGEPKTPEDPRQGKAWRSIADHTDLLDFENDFVTVSDLDRQVLHTHPWSLRGGGALEAKLAVEDGAATALGEEATGVGFASFTGQNEAFLIEHHSAHTSGFEPALVRPYVQGESVRDWGVAADISALVPYDRTDPGTHVAYDRDAKWGRHFWTLRTTVWSTTSFGGKTRKEHGEPFWTWYRWVPDRYRLGRILTYAYVATHNHFSLVREPGANIAFNNHASVVTLSADATEDDHLGLLGLLNSSTACFWMKQVFFNKGYGADSKGARMRDVPFEDFYEFDGTKIKQFPLSERRPLELARRLDDVAQELADLQPSAIAEIATPRPNVLDASMQKAEQLARCMVALQEELDWRCYELYGLLEQGQAPLAADFSELLEVKLGERAFEFVIARKMSAGEGDSTWFERHGSTPTTEIPSHWPAWYRELVQRRINLIEQKRFIRLIEQPEYKRRWNQESWKEKEQAALRNWSLDRLESPRYVPQADREGEGAYEFPQLFTTRALADIAQRDEDFMVVAERWTGNSSFDVHELVKELVLSESVPFLPSMRYKGKGIRKRKDWERVWELQRREDAGEKVDIPKPPKYTKGDFTNGNIYKLRGKLDVPKERFTTYPGLSRDGDPVISWAGLDHRQRAQALAEWYNELRFDEGWEAEALAPALAGLLDLLPWVLQWHNHFDAATGVKFGDFLSDFVEQESREVGVDVRMLQQFRLT